MTNEIKAEIIGEPKINEYEICEHKKDVGLISIFDLGVEDVIYEKMYIMFEIIDPAQNNLDKVKLEKQTAKDKILLETDFSEVLGKARTNKEEREAYMKAKLSSFDDKIEECKNRLKFYTNKLEILNDLIRTKQLMLKLEGAIRE